MWDSWFGNLWLDLLSKFETILPHRQQHQSAQHQEFIVYETFMMNWENDMEARLHIIIENMYELTARDTHILYSYSEFEHCPI